MLAFEMFKGSGEVFFPSLQESSSWPCACLTVKNTSEPDTSAARGLECIFLTSGIVDRRDLTTPSVFKKTRVRIQANPPPPSLPPSPERSDAEDPVWDGFKSGGNKGGCMVRLRHQGAAPLRRHSCFLKSVRISGVQSGQSRRPD